MAVCLASCPSVTPDETPALSASSLERLCRAGRDRSSDGPLDSVDRVGDAAFEDASATTSLGRGTGTPDRVGRMTVGLDGSSSESDSSSHLPLDLGATLLLAAEYAVLVAAAACRDRYSKPKMHRSQALKTSGWREKRVMESSKGRTVSR